MKLRADQKQRLRGLRDKIQPWQLTQAIEVFDAMVKAKGDRILASALLGIGQTTLYYKIETYRLRRRINEAVAKSS